MGVFIDPSTGKVFSDKLRHIYIELPRFVKAKADCDSYLEYWIYNLANMKELKEISFKDRDSIFGRLEEIASRANLSKEERTQYEYEWKINNDYFNCLDYARKEGRAEGEEYINRQHAKKMKEMNLPIETICQITGLSEDVIKSLE